MHIKLTNGQPEIYTIGQLRRDNPQTSFPRNIPDELLATYDVYPLVPTERPATDHTKNVVEDVADFVEGVWVQTWAVTDATPSEIEQRVLERAQSVRSERDYFLQSTDWRVIKSYENGQNLPAEWATYRQSLRDVTAQTGFPFEITWPAKPNEAG